jgi:transposase-like protein
MSNMDDVKEFSKEDIIQKIQYAKELIEAYKKYPNLDISKLYANLRTLKSIIEKCNTDGKVEHAHAQLAEYLDKAEAYETVRIERWADGIRCPYCRCEKIELLAEENRKLHNYYRYLCSECQQQFNDTAKSPLEEEVPSIDMWMEAWYLYGCTQNISYIAAKLGLDTSLVKSMINELQNLFNTKQPVTKLEEKFDKWQQRFSALEKSIKENILEKTSLLHGKDTSKQARDTAEHRKQHDRKHLLNLRPKS